MFQSEKLVSALFLRMLLVLAITFVGACSSSGDDMEEGAGESAPAAAPAEAEPQATPAEVQEESTMEQKKASYVKAYLDRADKLMAASQYAAARDQVLEALNLEPKSAAAKAKLEQVNGLLGEGSQDLSAQVIRHKQSQREKKVVEVNDRFVRAQQHYNSGDYAEALVQLELADLTMRYDPYQTDYGTLVADAAALMAETKRTQQVNAAAVEEGRYREAFERLKAEEEKERRKQGETIKALMFEAVDAFARQDFDSSEELALRVMDLQPSLREAQDLVEYSRRARQSHWRSTYYTRRREQFQAWKESVRETQIPYHHIIAFPSREKWDQISARRRSRDNAQAGLDDSAAVSDLKNMLANTRVTWEFTDVTLNEAVQTMRDTLNLNILLSRTAMEEKGEETVDFKVNDVELGSALKILLESLELTHIYKYDMVYVVGNAESSGDVVPRVYEVRDLTIQLANFRPPSLALRPGPAGEAAQTAIFGEELEPTQDTQPEQLVELVRDNIASSSWDIEDRVLEISSNQLVAVTTPEIHREIDQFLEDLRRFTKVIVHVEARFISIREGFLSDIGVDVRGLGGSNPGTVALLDDVTNGPDDNAGLGLSNSGAGLPAASSLSPNAGFFFNDYGEFDLRGTTENVFNQAIGQFLTNTGGASIGFTFLDDMEFGLLLRAVEKSAFAHELTGPRLTIYNNQRANLTIVNQISYVKDYDVEVAQTAYIADPLVDLIQDGIVLDVRPTVSWDRKYVTMEVRPTVARLDRPIATFTTSLAGLTTNVVIELPTITYKSAETTVKVPDNGYLVIGGLKDVSTVDRRSETPILSQIPILSFFFSRKGRSDEISDVLIVMHVQIVDLNEKEAALSR